MTHPQAKPTKVTDFQNIERIITSVLATASNSQQKDGQSSSDQNNHKGGKDSSGASNGANNVQNGQSGKMPSSPSMNKKSDKRSVNTCNCNEIKTLLKIKVTGNSDDLVITCNGVKSAESIADLVDGYCRIVNNTEMSLWDRFNRTPTNSATNSLEKNAKQLPSQPSKTMEQHLHMPATEFPNLSVPPEASNSEAVSGSGIAASSKSTIGAANFDPNMPILSEDYADIGLGEEEGDYSTPAARNYELDRSQIVLNEIIGIGQFGDVHIGTCRINKAQKPKSHNDSGNDDSSQKDGSNGSTNGSDGDKNIIHVAVKTCKADADLATSEKFLEEACKCMIEGFRL